MELAVTLPGTFDEQAFETFLASRDEPAWVTDARRKAFAVFQEKSAAPLDPEEWKRVDLRTFRPEKFRIDQPESSVQATFKTLMQDRGEFVGHVTHVNGRCTQADLAEDLKAKGVLFGDLSEMVREHPEVIEPHLQQRAVAMDTDRFSAWHAAFWTGGTVLYVPRNVEIIEPLYSLIAISQAGQADFSHTLVILEDGASATLLEETASADENSPGLHVGCGGIAIRSRSPLAVCANCRTGTRRPITSPTKRAAWKPTVSCNGPWAGWVPGWLTCIKM